MLPPRKWFQLGELPARDLTNHYSFLTSSDSKNYTWGLRVGWHSLNSANGERFDTNGLHLVLVPDHVRQRFMNEHPTEEASSFYRLLHRRLGTSKLPAYLHEISVTAPLQHVSWHKEGLFVTFRSAQTEFANQHMACIVKQNSEPFPAVVTPSLRILCGDFSTTSSPAPLTVGCALQFRLLDMHLFDFETAASDSDVSVLVKSALFQYTFMTLNVSNLRARNTKSVQNNPSSGSGKLCLQSSSSGEPLI